MDRRTFLKATLVTAGSLFVGGCGSSGGGGGGGDAGDAGTDADGGRTLEPGDAFFPHSLASGDPRPDGLILWTRVEDAARATDDLQVELEVALDEAFTQLVTLDGGASMMLTAEAFFDHCVKARLVGLEAATVYYYRFIYTSGGTDYVTKTGSAKTAPAPGADVPVRFAFVSCQDYNGRYYNTLRRMASEDLDFFVHLGDYVYETTGDPSFQNTFPGRVVTFTDEAGAIVFNAGTDTEYFAAKSLSNYRELYKTYRSDPDLQGIHERVPMIAIWDDHEFSDDCWDATATYFDGRQDEHDVNRRKAANQAWFEYMPVDYPDDPTFRYDPQATYPDDIKIYRDYSFGAHVRLVLTDLRTYRADHLVPEDALPGAIAMTQAQLQATVGSLPDFAAPYVDIDTYADGLYATAIQGAAADLGIDPAKVTGLIAVDYINTVVAGINENLDQDHQIPLISADDQASLDRGLAFFQMLKTSPYSSLGSRYFVVKATFLIYAAFRWAQSSGASEAGMGDTQQAWFLQTMGDATQTWKVWANEFTLQQRDVDLSFLTSLPEQFRQKIRLSAEDWDGMPNRRDTLVQALAAIDNTVVVSGDIHAFFAGLPHVEDDLTTHLVEFVGGAVSSASYKTLLYRTAISDPTLAAAGAGDLANAVHLFLTDKNNRPNPHLAFDAVDQHGYAAVVASGDTFEVTFQMIPEDQVSTNLGADLDSHFSSVRFKVNAGSRDLYRDFDGTWKKWSTDQMDWVEA